MASREPDQTLEDLTAWTISRAMPDIDDEWSEGWEALRSKLLDWIEERRQADVRRDDKLERFDGGTPS